MTLRKTCTATIIVVAAALPAFAQHHARRASRATVGRVGAVVRGAPRPFIRGRISPALPRVYAAPFRAFRAPAYAFQPRVNLAVGLVAGYPRAYPSYGYPYSYPVAPIASAGPLGYGAEAGGISFAITPYDAQVFVDGRAIGIADRFSPRSDPLILAPGRHHVEIRSPGFRPAAFETDVTPNVVIPYYGTLQR